MLLHLCLFLSGGCKLHVTIRALENYPSLFVRLPAGRLLLGTSSNYLIYGSCWTNKCSVLSSIFG